MERGMPAAAVFERTRSARSAFCFSVAMLALVGGGCVEPSVGPDVEPHSILTVIELPPIGQFTPHQFAEVDEPDLTEHEITWSEFHSMRADGSPSRERRLQESEVDAVKGEIRAMQSATGNWTDYDGVLFQFRLADGPVYRYALGRAVS